MSGRQGVTAVGLLVLWAVLSVWQLAHARPLQEFAIDSWTTRHGLPHNSPRDIAQTPDGQLWLATWEGLVRYNGLEFSTFDRSTRPGLLDNGLGALHVDAKGQLWLGDSRGNVLRQDSQGNWRAYPAQSPSPGVLIQAIRSDEQGRTWLLFEGKGVGHLDDQGQFQFTPPPDDVSMALTYPRMEIDAQGQIWVGTLEGLVLRGVDGQFRHPPASFGLAEGPAWPYRAPDGVMWIVNANAIYRMEQGRPRLHHRFAGILAITEMLVDRVGNVWVGSESDGVMRLDTRGRVERLADSHQPSGRILSLYEDVEGSIWIGANGGLFRAREALFSSVTVRDGLSGDYQRAIIEDGQGGLWAGGPQGLDYIGSDGRIRHQDLPTLRARPGKVSVLSLGQSADGAIWVGTYADGVFRIDRTGRVRQFADVQSLSSGNVRALVDDGQGGMWVGSQGGLLRIRDGEVTKADFPGLPRELITALIIHDGDLWIGSTEGVRRLRNGRAERIPVTEASGARTTFGFRSVGAALWLSTDRGLLRLRNGVLAHIGVEQGLKVDTVFQMTADPLGNAWLSSNRGVLRADLASLDAVADGQQKRIDFERYGEIDGMVNAQGNGSSGPIALLRTDGTFWVATAGGLVSMDPRRLQGFHERLSPPAMIESLIIDGAAVNWRGRTIELPPGGRMSVSFVGLSYLLSERIRYRTRVLGLDDAWVERGTQRNVEFVGLPPGDYTLEVQAQHPGGNWQGKTAELSFRVAPSWWQRPWVWVLLGGLLMSLGWLVHRLAIWHYQERARKLAEQVQARTLDIQFQAERLLAANQEKNALLNQLREQAESFERQAHEDVLTGLANRRAFDEALGREFARHQRSDHPVCLVVLDIDHFKSINDRFTHAVGDLVLAEVGQLLLSACREGDMAARLGGEEFALLLADTRLRDAEQVCARLKVLFSSRQDWGGIGGLRVTFSAGLVEVGATDRFASALYKRADSALYRAKNDGRDMICVG